MTVWLKYLFIPALCWSGWLQAQQFVCYLDLDYSKIDYTGKQRQTPKLIYPCFVLEDGRWREYTHADYDKLVYQKKFHFYYQGRHLQPIYASGRYDAASSTDALNVSQHQLPKAGKPVAGFHKFEGLVTSPPLLTLNKRISGQSSLIKTVQPPVGLKERIDSVLVQKAGELGLGPVPRFTNSLVDTINNTWQLNDTLLLIQANINLQMYCYQDTVPFIKADTHKWNAIDKQPGFHRLQSDKNSRPVTGGPGYNDLIKWVTQDCFFLKYGNNILYIDRSLYLMDMADLDADGKQELIFRKQGSSYISYLLLTDNFKTKLQHRIIQWW